MNEAPPTLATLRSWLDEEMSALAADASALNVRLHANEETRSAIAHHPNHDRFALGGVLTAAGLSQRHIGVVHCWLVQPWAVALSLLQDDGSPGQPAYLLRRLPQAADRDPGLVEEGTDYLRAQGLLIDDELPRPWLREDGKFGLGVPLASAGLRAGDRQAFAGLWTIRYEALCTLASKSALCSSQALKDLLRPMIDAQRDRLTARGAKSDYLRARTQYLAHCASFAAFDAQDHAKHWRGLPPTRRQGFLAAATARALALPPPRFQTRGEASDWLRECGANLRFNCKENDQ